MRSPSLASCASALLLLVAVARAHKGVHDQLESIHRRHRESRSRRAIESPREEGTSDVVKRGGQCAFPTDAGLVAVTPGAANAGWAMSPDQPCQPGNYCPYACPPGQVSMQWDPKATSYSYPLSMHGGLYCDSNGNINKPFPDKPYCQSTVTNIGVVNNAGGSVAFCQTVLPGNEAMLIPTAVDGFSTLAVPGTDYWASTAAHYYINPPGTSVNDACVWGTNSNPFGNWSPYVAGTNVDSTGKIYIKLGWNPIYLETTTPFRNVMPNWGVKIDCPGGECGGLPCQIDPDYNKVNQMKGDTSIGAGAATFCVVSVPQGATANFVVFGGNSGSTGSTGSAPSSPSSPSGAGGAGAFSGASAKGGQFYQSSSVVSSSSSSSASTSSNKAVTTTTSMSSSPAVTSSSATVASTTSTTIGTSTSSWSNWSSGSSSASSSEGSTAGSSSTTSSITGSSSQSASGPTGQPYYSLFNTSAAPSSALEAASSTKSQVPAATSGIPISSSTGGATSLTWSMASIAPLAMWVFLL